MKSKETLSRESNIELARIVAMFMVLVLHALNHYFYTNNTYYWTLPSIVDNVGVSFTSCANGLFVFISGWFGIKPRMKSLLNIFFQVVFYGLMCFLLGFFITGSFTDDGWKDIFLLSPDSLWFIRSYILLFIISPLLNHYVEHVEEKKIRIILILLFFFQSIWGWTNAAQEYNYGFSVLFFIFIYLLARYLKKYPNPYIKGKSMKFLLIYVCSALLIVISLYIKHFSRIPITEKMLLSTVNPLTIICSISLFFFFNNIRLLSKTVNWVSASVLSVYLIHENSVIAPYYRNLVWGEFLERKYLFLFFSIVLFFCICVLVDQIRQLLFKHTIGRIIS